MHCISKQNLNYTHVLDLKFLSSYFWALEFQLFFIFFMTYVLSFPTLIALILFNHLPMCISTGFPHLSFDLCSQSVSGPIEEIKNKRSEIHLSNFKSRIERKFSVLHTVSPSVSLLVTLSVKSPGEKVKTGHRVSIFF